MGNKKTKDEPVEQLDEKQLKSMDEKRQRVIKEIISTEKSYGEQLKVVIDFYEKPMRFDKVTKEATINQIFGNVDTIYQLHTIFLDGLQKMDANSNVSQEFLKLADAMKLYSVYINNYDASRDTVERKMKQKKKFTKFINDQKVKSKCHLDIYSLLIVPIQRLPRYVLLLEELLKSTWAKHSDHEGLKNAVGKIRSTVNHVNEGKRKIECHEKLSELQAKIASTSKIQEIIKPVRLYELEMEINMIVANNERVAVLLVVFNDALLVGKKVMEKKKEKIDVIFLLEYTSFDSIDGINGEDKMFKVTYTEGTNPETKKPNVVQHFFETKTCEDAETLIDKVAVRIPKKSKKKGSNIFTTSLFSLIDKFK